MLSAQSYALSGLEQWLPLASEVLSREGDSTLIHQCACEEAHAPCAVPKPIASIGTTPFVIPWRDLSGSSRLSTPWVEPEISGVAAFHCDAPRILPAFVIRARPESYRFATRIVCGVDTRD